MNKLAVFACVMLMASMAVAVRPEEEYKFLFKAWMKQHNRMYENWEVEKRFAIFKQNVDKVESHNADESRSFKMAMNRYGDLTHEEFKAKVLGRPRVYKAGAFKASVGDDQVDWRQKGAVTPIKNQGQCGSCWSFSTTGSMEGAWAIAGNSLVSLSEQQLVDCSGSYGNAGCDGGLMTAAFEYIINTGGLESESEYPYTAEDGTCSVDKSKFVAHISSYVNVTSGDENDLKTQAGNGPVSVAIDASQESFQFYSTGIYSDPNCSTTQLDHGVLVVGYGSDSDGKYYIVKNSWGTTWGEEGFFKLARDQNNMCGVATMASRPSV